MKVQRLKRWMFPFAAASALLMVLAACTAANAPTATVGGTVGSSNGSGTTASSNTGGNGVANASYAQLYAGGGSGQQLGIWVSGAGKVTAKADIGVLSFGVDVRDTTVALARDKAATAMTAALKALSDKKVADKDVQTNQFSIYPIIVYDPKVNGGNTPHITGYEVTNSATAKIRALDTFGSVIDAVAAAGGDVIRINNIGFSIENPKPLETQARQLALQDAMAKAQQIAQVTGVKLGPPTFISESGGSPIIQAKSFAVGAASADSATTPINPGDQDVQMSVQMVFSIQ